MTHDFTWQMMESMHDDFTSRRVRMTPANRKKLLKMVVPRCSEKTAIAVANIAHAFSSGGWDKAGYNDWRKKINPKYIPISDNGL